MPPKQDSSKSETAVSFSSQSTEKTAIQVLKQSKIDPAKQSSRDNAYVKKKHFNKAPEDPEEREIGSDSTELTDDSDLYSDDDQEDASCISVRVSWVSCCSSANLFWDFFSG